MYPWENVYANTFTGNLTGNASGYSTYVLTSAMSNANNSMKASQGLYYSFQSQSSNWGAASGHGIRLQRSVGTNQTSSQSILDIQTATGSSEDIYVRKAYGSDSTNTITYLPWRTLIHSGNISSYTGAYLPLTGGTMAGNINMSTRLTITSTGTFILHLVV